MEGNIMDIKKLRTRAIAIVTKNSDAFGDKIDKEEAKLSDKALKVREAIVKIKHPFKFRKALLDVMSIVLEEDIQDGEEETYIPCHVIVVRMEKEDIELIMGSIYLSDDEDDEEIDGELFYRVFSNGKRGTSESYELGLLSCPTADQIKTFINGLPEKIIRSEFHYLVH